MRLALLLVVAMALANAQGLCSNQRTKPICLASELGCQWVNSKCTALPTAGPTLEPTTLQPTVEPTTGKPTKLPTTSKPTKRPTERPTPRPSSSPTMQPTERPTSTPTARPTASPTPVCQFPLNGTPCNQIIAAATCRQFTGCNYANGKCVMRSNCPTMAPSSLAPSPMPTPPTFTTQPTLNPTFDPATSGPTTPVPSQSPTVAPTDKKTRRPSPSVTNPPTAFPTHLPQIRACFQPDTGCSSVLDLAQCRDMYTGCYVNVNSVCVDVPACVNNVLNCGMKSLGFLGSSNLLPGCVRGKAELCNTQRDRVYQALELTSCGQDASPPRCEKGGCTLRLDNKLQEEEQELDNMFEGEWFVDPVLGVDSGNEFGSKSQPFATIQFAIEHSRQWPLILRRIWLMAGTHRIHSTLLITPQDSGLTIQGQNGGGAVVSGAALLGDLAWEQNSINNQIWQVDLTPELLAKLGKLSMLYVDGRPAIRARYPNLAHFLDTQYISSTQLSKWTRKKDVPAATNLMAIRIKPGEYGSYYSATGGACTDVFTPPQGYFCNPKHEAQGGCPFSNPSGVAISQRLSTTLNASLWKNSDVHLHVFHHDHWGLWTYQLKNGPTQAPTTLSPTKVPTTGKPSSSPTTRPSKSPIIITPKPTKTPTRKPTKKPTRSPTRKPTKRPTARPTMKGFTYSPTSVPSASPSATPSTAPTPKPTLRPTTLKPTKSPTTLKPTFVPTQLPTIQPASVSPTLQPTLQPTRTPTSKPSASPTFAPSKQPTRGPTSKPSASPTFAPSKQPTTKQPTTKQPSTMGPTLQPTLQPVNWNETIADASDVPFNLYFNKGGFQEARGDCGQGKSGDFFVENDFTMLDAVNEFYLDLDLQRLFFIPNTTLPNRAGRLELSVLRELVRLTGTSTTPVRDFHLVDVEFENTYPTHMDGHEVPSGGDWTVHRGAAVVFEGAEDSSVYGCQFRFLGGNGLLVSNYGRDLVVERNDFYALGSSAILLVGDPLFASSTPENRVTNVEHIERVLVRENVASELGMVVKQSAGVFLAIAKSIMIQNNIVFNSARAGIVYNDGFGGNTTMTGNFVFNTVMETLDHGPFNIWDRQQWKQDAKVNPTTFPFVVENNYLIGNLNGYKGVDIDDGARNFRILNNVIYKSVQKLKGQDIDVVGNILFPNLYACMYMTPLNLEPAALTYTGNTCYSTSKPLLPFYYNVNSAQQKKYCAVKNFLAKSNKYYGLSTNWKGCGGVALKFNKWKSNYKQDVGSEYVATLPPVNVQLQSVIDKLPYFMA
ncbi:hypothetical protein BASA81_010255 [Batrachochytrium salamandrivorans]|nr:hypothetical protein BASA81_010255 [Batrachochytrium salamandrivorans]